MTLSESPPHYIPWSESTALEIIHAHAREQGPLLPILHAIQETFGYVAPLSITLIANVLNLSRADVYGVFSFYSDFRSTPPGQIRVQVCRGEACQSVGGRVLAEHATNSLGVGFGETTADASVTLDEVFCLGNCALGPSVAINGHLHGRVAADGFDRLVQGTTNIGLS